MKKLFALVLAALMLLSGTAFAEGADAFTSASVADFYGDFALTGDELMNAINSYSGAFIVSTVNPDGSANAAFFCFGMVKKDDIYYVQLGLAPNQSMLNLQATGEGVAVYAAAPTDQSFSTAGARMTLKLVTDEALINELKGDSEYAPMFCEVTEIRPLG